MFSPLEQFDVLMIKQFTFHKYGLLLDLSIFNVVLVLFFIWMLLKIVLSFGKVNARLVPTAWQTVWEGLYVVVLTIVKQQVGERGFVYFPLFFCLFITILLSNLFSLMPFTFALTSYILNIFFLSFTLISGLFLIGLIKFGVAFLKLFIPECPFLLLFILIPIELFSYLIRAFSLAIRLSANIMAGHTLVFIVSGFLLKLTPILQLTLVTILLLILSLELGVAFLQAYVFTVLLGIYLKDSLFPAQH